jgi:hypothetical protein
MKKKKNKKNPITKTDQPFHCGLPVKKANQF